MLGARQTRGHTCHWAGCGAQVKPAMWGCKEHWFRLPKRLRDRIWHAYRPGQEEDGRPSLDYIAAAREGARLDRRQRRREAVVSARRRLSYGEAPVPYTVSWSGEERHFVGVCPHAGRPALCQAVAPGEGRPAFGKPHSGRQREVVALGLCDLCGGTLKSRTKVSLSHARWRDNALVDRLATGILQVEPLLHRECAATSMRYCPSLRRDTAAGTLMVRQVTRWRCQFAVMAPEFIGHYVPGYVAGAGERIIGHAKVELLDWLDRDAAWLAG